MRIFLLLFCWLFFQLLLRTSVNILLAQIRIKTAVPIFSSGVMWRSCCLYFRLQSMRLSTPSPLLKSSSQRPHLKGFTMKKFIYPASVRNWKLSNLPLMRGGRVLLSLFGLLSIFFSGSKWFLQSQNLSSRTDKRFSFLKFKSFKFK